MKTVEVGQRIALKNVLFATDFSACSNAALPYAVSIGRKFGAKLFVTHVVPTAAEMLLASPEIWPPSFEAEEKKVKECMEPLEKHLQGYPMRW